MPKHASKKIVTIRGHQLYVDVKNGSNGTQLFTSTNYVAISPDSMGTQVASHANMYDKYRFTSLVFQYLPINYNMICANDDFTSGIPNAYSSNLFTFGYENDATSTFTATYGTIAQLSASKVIPLQGYRNSRDNTFRASIVGNRWYYTKDDTSNSATSRQTIQGTLYGEARTSMTNSNLWGAIRISYVVQFTEACPTQGVTMSVLMKEVSMGITHNLNLLVTGLKHACQYGIGGPTPDMLNSLSNEELFFITGSGRPAKAPQEEEDSSSSFEVVGALKQLENLVTELQKRRA